MSRSSSPSSCDLATVLALAAAVTLAACSDDGGPACGPGDAPAAGITLTVGGETITYGGFTASVNNDCTDFSSGVISVTIHATQVGGAGTLTLCLPRPDLLGAGPFPLVPSVTPPASADRVHLVDASATLAGGCTVARDAAAVPAATASFLGYCDGGDHPDGYALVLDGTVGLTRTCPAGVDAVAGTVGGTVAITVE